VITLPPLRARQDDVPLLVEHFGRRMAVGLDWSTGRGSRRERWPSLSLSQPGNVRELRNVVERAVYLQDPGGRLKKSSLTLPFPQAPSAAPQLTFPPMAAANEERRRLPLRRLRPRAATSDFRASVTDYERQLLDTAAKSFNQRATAARWVSATTSSGTR
jgi:psp operon transcriptional activator